MDAYCADLRITDTNWLQCECCGAMSGGFKVCGLCFKRCCNQCMPSGGQSFTISRWFSGLGQHVECCHKCARQPKSDVELDAFRPLSGMDWYFHYPCDGCPAAETPCVWCSPDRECRADPRLSDIVKIYKFRALESADRRVRPLNWQTGFLVTALLADAAGETMQVRINMFCFVMNKQWADHPLIKHVENWLPSNLLYVGDVFKPPDVHRELPPAPSSPNALSLLAELQSTVTVEEVESEEDDSPDWGRFSEARENVKRRRRFL